ncbi:TON1 Recruiting Motif 32 [Hibiscus trionum]|uniref:TON1 Recruiting Motif 32 n=1 Tax=Hibiscus trionum TaxID=183268 RepID=A0A9W7ILC7_HIBTR|nr:TON1 Recruiting Motif 32 [Hibiscus trionum]
MGKEFHEQADDVGLESYDHGCMGDIFPHKKNNRGLHGRCFGFGFGWMNPIILINKRAHISYSSSASSRADTMRSKKYEIHDRMNSGQHAKKVSKKVSYSQVKQGRDDLEVFKINKDVFLDILQDPGVGISQHFPRKQTSKAVKLTRSGSFPVSGLPCTRYVRFSTLEHKQKEVWSFRQGEKSVAGTQLSRGSDSQRWHRLVLSRLKDFKQRIKQTLKQVSIKDVHKKCQNVDSTDNEICNGGLHRMRRTKSINESLDRYTKLFEHSVNKEADLHHSKSLRISIEDQASSRELHGPKNFKSISFSSLSDIDSFRSLLHAVSRDALSVEVPIGSLLNYHKNKENDEHNEPKTINVHEGINKFELVEAVIEAELQEKMQEGSNRDSSSTNLSIDLNGEDIAKPCDLMEKTSPRQEQENAFGTRPTSEDKEADPSYNYVRDILELSGFLHNKCLHSWYSPDQPLNPSLFKELETFECSSIDELEANCDDDRRLVFDLVNEVLVEIGERTSIYFPKPFSCGISLMFKGNIVLGEVWRKVSRNLGFQLEHDESVDDIVGRDLETDGWIIFQPQTEFVALELEDLVFDEILDELLCL